VCGARGRKFNCSHSWAATNLGGALGELGGPEPASQRLAAGDNLSRLVASHDGQTARPLSLAWRPACSLKRVCCTSIKRRPERRPASRPASQPVASRLAGRPLAQQPLGWRPTAAKQSGPTELAWAAHSPRAQDSLQLARQSTARKTVCSSQDSPPALPLAQFCGPAAALSCGHKTLLVCSPVAECACDCIS